MNLDAVEAFKRLATEAGTAQAASLILSKLLQKIRNAPRTTLSSVKLKQLAGPIFIRPRTSDWYALDQVLLLKEYAERSVLHAAAMMSVYDGIVASGKTPLIIDCGANIGLSSIWYATHFPKARIVAIEPVRENFALLMRNTAPYANIFAINAAVSDAEGELSLRNDEADLAPMAWKTVEGGDGEKIEAVTINGVLHQHQNHDLLIVKIDIEGHEAALFRTNTEWVAAAPLISIELHDWYTPWAGTGNSVFSALTASGMRDYLLNGENVLSYSKALLAP